jgi:hypothetical protein
MFRDHYVKHENQVWLHILALIAEQLRLGRVQLDQVIQEGLGLRKEQIVKDYEKIDRLIDERERLRKEAIYVDIENNKISSPQKIGKEESLEVLDGVKFRLEYVKEFIKDFSQPNNFKLLQELFQALPSETKETGRLALS